MQTFCTEAEQVFVDVTQTNSPQFTIRFDNPPVTVAESIGGFPDDTEYFILDSTTFEVVLSFTCYQQDEINFDNTDTPEFNEGVFTITKRKYNQEQIEIIGTAPVKFPDNRNIEIGYLITSNQIPFTVTWTLRNGLDTETILSWQGLNTDESLIVAPVNDPFPFRPDTNFPDWIITHPSSSGTVTLTVPVVTIFDAESNYDNPYYAQFSADYYLTYQVGGESNITIADTATTYTYPTGTAYKIRCDGCEPGDCKASKETYPGYVCMDCKDLESRLKRIGNKLNEQIRR